LQARLRDKEGAKQLQAQRDQAQEYLQKQQKLLDEKLQDIQLVVNRSFVSLLPDAVEKALRLLDEKREKGEIPSGIREQFIEDLLDKGICVCGRPFAEHDDAHHALTSMLRKASSGELETIALRLAGNLRAMSTTAQSQTQRLQRLMREKSSIEEIIDDLQTRLEDIKHQLSRMPEEDIAGLERQLGKFQRDRDNYIAQIGALEERLRRIDGEIEAVRRKKDEAEAKERRSRLLARKESLAQRSADAIGRIKEEFFEYSRVEIEKATKEVFSTLAWKQEHFQDIQLDSSFRLEVIDRWGLPTRQELSAGERQILSLHLSVQW
jgi:DNA sulfur modification protein DndD